MVWQVLVRCCRQSKSWGGGRQPPGHVKFLWCLTLVYCSCLTWGLTLVRGDRCSRAHGRQSTRIHIHSTPLKPSVSFVQCPLISRILWETRARTWLCFKGNAYIVQRKILWTARRPRAWPIYEGFKKDVVKKWTPLSGMEFLTLV